MFVDLKLKSYFLDEGLSRVSFRDEKLYDHDVDMVFSMNQAAIKRIHKNYSMQSQ